MDWYSADHNPNALPYGGGLIHQPSWLRRDLRLLQMVRRWWQLNGKQPETTGLPRLDEH